MSAPLRRRLGTVRAMAPPPKFKVRTLVAYPVNAFGQELKRDDPSVGWDPLPGLQRAVPSRFDVVALLDEPPCHVRIEVFFGGDAGEAPRDQPVVHELTLRRLGGPPWGPPVNAGMLRRLAVDALVRKGIEYIAEPLIPREDVRGDIGAAGLVYQLQRDIEAGRDTVAYVAGSTTRPPTGRGRRTSSDVLQKVAEIYRGADRAPTQKVADELHVSRTHAGRLVAQARAAGFLGPTTPGKAGERR